ncbi:Transmembrane 9 superfamily member 2 [Bagarius yarrelli]|uniref:Transmembrane 9 superfamily member n=1 Tax=Bagarius yarrelli TaxID=175774 RepID=A0A556V2U6_BAGYA|nr:Transmembrane 9 superfamily member 2 [Bagarius yarrelli]
MKPLNWFRLVFSFIAVTAVCGFYLPGLAPVNFCEEDKITSDCQLHIRSRSLLQNEIQLFVNRLDSVESVLPYEYDVFDFCKDEKEKRSSENLGQVLFGERIETSPYKFKFRKDESCKKVCTKTYDTSNKKENVRLDFLKRGVELNYQHHWIVDNMPVTWCYAVEDGQNYCNPGFPIGCFVTFDGRSKDACVISSGFNKKNTYYLFNHVDITITYHSEESESWRGARLVSARLEPKSIKHNSQENSQSCDGPPMDIPKETTGILNVTYSYSVKFEEDAQEESGWKQVHGDVFRAPQSGMLLSVFLGQGTQIFIMTFITLSNRGALMTCAVVLWVLLGTPAGYVSARMYKSFGGEKWKTNVLLTALLCPGIVFADFFLMNLILWVEGSSAAVPFPTLVALLALWFGISVPLTFVGAYAGFKKTAIEVPVRTNQIPRQIPLQSFFTRPVPGIIMGGILPFGCIFIQLFFILNSIWSHQMYYMFGFLFLVFIILLITCSEATILLCYFHLCAEDYHWWWRSFLTSGFTAVYLFIYAIHYFFSKLQIQGAASTILYFGYTMIMVLIFFLFTGTIGFFACFWFVNKIYSVVKVD